MQNDEHQRGSFDGVVQIFIYNWPFYVVAIGVDLLALAVSLLIPLPQAFRAVVYTVAVIATLWAVSSLLVSHYIYDRSTLYEWEWLRTLLPQGAGSWVNIHAGLDQTTASLLRIFPPEQHRTFDIYQPSQMTEPSIARARRRVRVSALSDAVNPAALPLADRAWDTVFVIFAAHELRSHDSRVALFTEIHRVLKPGGKIIIVEHLRDWKNFLAYGPGFLHFFSAKDWLNVSDKAGCGLSINASLRRL